VEFRGLKDYIGIQEQGWANLRFALSRPFFHFISFRLNCERSVIL